MCRSHGFWLNLLLQKNLPQNTAPEVTVVPVRRIDATAVLWRGM